MEDHPGPGYLIDVGRPVVEAARDTEILPSHVVHQDDYNVGRPFAREAGGAGIMEMKAQHGYGRQSQGDFVYNISATLGAAFRHGVTS
jgi:hypothetical protein